MNRLGTNKDEMMKCLAILNGWRILIIDLFIFVYLQWKLIEIFNLKLVN